MLYLDDLFSGHPEKSVHESQWKIIKNDVARSGFVISVPKQEETCQSLTLLGMGYNSVTGRVFIPEKKLATIQLAIHLLRPEGAKVTARS